MWERCEEPEDLDTKKMVVALDTRIKLDMFSGPLHIGYTRGCIALIICFKEFTPQEVSTPLPLRPKGSASSSSSESEEDFKALKEEVLNATKLTVFELLKLLQSQRLPSPLPPILDWETAQTMLVEIGWNEGGIEWWYSESGSKLSLPRTIRLPLPTIMPEETGASMLKRCGVFQIHQKFPFERWVLQPVPVKRFWKSMFGISSFISIRMDITRKEYNGMLNYVNRSLPRMLKTRRRRYPLVPDMSDILPPCDPDFFIRLFDFALLVRKNGTDVFFDHESYDTQAYKDILMVMEFMRCRYPWVRIGKADEILLSIHLEHICSILWEEKDLITLPKSGPIFTYDREYLWSVMADYVEVSQFAMELEKAASIFHLKHPLVLGRKRVDTASIKKRLDSLLPFIPPLPTAMAPRIPYVGDRHLGFPYCYKTKKLPKFKHWKQGDQPVIDLGWVRRPRKTDDILARIPPYLFGMRFPQPAMPFVEEKDEKKLRHIYSAITQDEQFVSTQRFWYRSIPVMYYDKEALFISTALSSFTRVDLQDRLLCLLELNNDFPRD